MRSSWQVEEVSGTVGRVCGVWWTGEGWVCLIFPLYVGVYLLLTLLWQGQLYLRKWRGLEHTLRCRGISYSLLDYSLKIPPAKKHVPHNTYFMALDVGEQYQSQTHRPLEYLDLAQSPYCRG
jgi:hypothetical protein